VGRIYLDGTPGQVCQCVYQAVFAACYLRYKEIRERHAGTTNYKQIDVEFVTDFDMAARRCAASSEVRHPLRNLLFGNLGLAASRAQSDRIEAFQAKVGEHLFEIGLFPVHDYFTPARHKQAA
jgi:hypothetical protein